MHMGAVVTNVEADAYVSFFFFNHSLSAYTTLPFPQLGTNTLEILKRTGY